jgi:hypothetical protein
MKRLFYIAIPLSILLSCKGKNDGDDQSNANGKQLDQSPVMIQQFKPVINGVWIKKNYIKKLIKSRSPLEAAERAEGITTFYIDTEKITGDSLKVAVNMDNRKDTSVVLRFQPGRNTTTIMLGDDELSYNIKRNDTTLLIYHYNQRKRETTSDKYIKASEKPVGDKLIYNMDYAINRGLMAGNYQAADAAGKNFRVSFTEDGKVSGLPGYSTYFIQNALDDDKDKADLIIFNRGSQGEKIYAFKKEKKSLTLYETTGTGPSLQAGIEKYKLDKK